ncbi:MAG: PHP domain-containing protein [Tepidiformaceae bacterium]
MAIGDFHLHSTASDGVHPPTWVMETAAARGVRVLSLTDHDSTEGFAEAKQAAKRLGLRLVPGMELSTDLGKADVHLLGFGMNIESKALQEFLAWQREGRIGRVRKMVDLLHANGMPVELERVLAIAGEATVGRPHVARAMVERGFVATVQEAFDLWLGNGKAIDVDREKLEPADAIKMIHENNGVVFVAHAIYIGEDYPAAVTELAGWGLDGIETYYKHYDPDTVEKHRALAARLGLATSGGSDYHGLGNPDDHEIGDIPFPEREVNRFLAFLEGRGVETGKQAHTR